ncbi:Cadmium resistance protein CadD, predicted permease [Ruegeria lacuscaerulensis ITI-1157]|nr:Cadmium resistance protein CadD, predicted permease [Ruegeria lacuscaerulensis ITI-1157]
MLDQVVFAASAFMAQVLTNLDNLMALVALMIVTGPQRAVLGFLLAQGLVIGAAFLLALGVEDAVPHWAGYLGTIPLALGLFGAVRQIRGANAQDAPEVSGSASALVTMLLFASLSMDTFAVLAPLLADSTPEYRLAGALGAGLAALSLAVAGLIGGRARIMTGRLAQRLEYLVPYVMICAGLYILSNSWTDAVQ